MQFGKAFQRLLIKGIFSMKNNLLLLKPWTAPKIWKLWHTRIFSVHFAYPDCLWRCVSHWLQRDAWRNVGGHDMEHCHAVHGGCCLYPCQQCPQFNASYPSFFVQLWWDAYGDSLTQECKARGPFTNLPRSKGLWKSSALLSAWQQAGYTEDNNLRPWAKGMLWPLQD